MTSHQTENNAPKNGAPNNTAPAAGHGPHGASEDPQNIYLLKEAPILKALLSLGVPMALGLAITSIYNVVNSYFVGHYGGTEDLAATSYGVPVFGVIMAIAGLFGLGSSTLASRKLGEGQPAHEIHRVTSFALYSALGAGVIAAIIGFILADPITGIMGASGGSYEPTRIYVHLMFLGAPSLSACSPWNSWSDPKATPSSPCTASSSVPSSPASLMCCSLPSWAWVSPAPAGR